jgi:hypothetical protein
MIDCTEHARQAERVRRAQGQQSMPKESTA